MNLNIFIPMLFVVQALYLLIGKRACKNLKSCDDYFLAGKTVRFFPLMMTFLATQVGGGLILGAAEEAYQFGWPVILYPMGASLGLILLGSGISKKMARFNVSTVAQIFEVAYSSALLRKIASVLSVISLFMILVAQMIASNKFLLNLGVTSPWIFVGFWGIVFIYTAQGGLKALISTDMVQAVFFSVVFTACVFIALFFNSSSIDFSMFEFKAIHTVSARWCGWLLMPLLFMVIEQDMGQRCFAGSTPKVVSRASFWAGVATLCICCIPIFFGVLAQSTALSVPKGSSVLMVIIAKMTNPWITALVGCAILAAIISTASSLITAISSNLASDFNFSFLVKKYSIKGCDASLSSSFEEPQNRIRLAQLMTFLICISAIFASFFFHSIVSLLIQSYELSVSCLFVPILMALFKRKGDFLAALLSIILGCTGFVFFRFYWLQMPREIISVMLSLAGYLIGARLAIIKMQRKQRVDHQPNDVSF